MATAVEATVEEITALRAATSTAPIDDLPVSLKLPPCKTDDGRDSGTTFMRNVSSGSSETERRKYKKDRHSDEGSADERDRMKKKRTKGKRSRIRTKFLLESYRSELESLQRENAELRRIVAEQLPPDKVDVVFRECLLPTPPPPSPNDEEEEDEACGDMDVGMDEWAEILSDQLWIE
uniref:BZIP domain-containing protein n=1 Tax=Pseudictyota dubia TaxID=2749911 RepID=A0A7R9ZF98_9STRA|mmetsp:Transcript_49616/g.91833  ORF Transcript_49616/g.91833 Transcript_49616/m.91833 type:complete len:178 (+) Transcript_49616:126-659(+)|eukprot:CAMPEP_0197442896 /NCGR_PEP_ID=MMETSP1175-20131217/8798_1 /TAXON_ID=1003142 /ORGANISM="Triceratium dubium, Strain CCMP147" /LENGTH=177 /DNA_ID=CAMNT_0042973453 /DNA_START=124 /DNA_END=657 /DNA_ORIENTATION=+